MVAARIAQLRQQGFPVRDSDSYLARLGPKAGAYRCHFKKVCLRVEPNGDILDCAADGIPLANVRTVGLRSLLQRPAFRDFQRRAEACHQCRDASPIEVSHIWEGRVEAIWNAVKSFA